MVQITLSDFVPFYTSQNNRGLAVIGWKMQSVCQALARH